MDAAFHALAHPVRRRILDIVRADAGANVSAVSAHFEMSRIAVMKHLNVLEESDLLVSEREGRERRLYFNIVPIQMIYDRWTSRYSSLWGERLTDLKYAVETRED
jgi:DNA-binding transcriptional ArsR family regulator